MLQSMGLQRVRCDSATEQQHEHDLKIDLHRKTALERHTLQIEIKRKKKQICQADQENKGILDRSDSVQRRSKTIYQLGNKLVGPLEYSVQRGEGAVV